MPEAVTRPPFNVIQPGTYASVNATALAEAALGEGQPIPAYLGLAEGGAPNTALFFASPNTAANVLRGGKLYEAVRLAFRAGISPICAVRIGHEVKQGTLALAAVTSGTCVTLTSRDYGAWVNSIKVTVESGPILKLVYVSAEGFTYKQEWNLTGLSTNAEIAEAINGTKHPYISSPFVTAVAGSGTGGLKTASEAPLTGGSNGESSLTNTNWSEGLTALETQSISTITPASGEASIHALVLAHCEAMSTPQAKKRRTAVLGGEAGENEAQTKARITSLGSSARYQLVWPGIEVPNTLGENTLFAPFYTAAIVAAMHCATPDQATSLIHAYVPIVGTEKELSTALGGAVESLLEGNVTPIVKAPGGGFWIVDDLSGYTLSNGVFRDFLKIRSADAIAEGLERSLSPLVGTKALASQTERLKMRATAYLKGQLNRLLTSFGEVTVEGGPTQAPVVTPENSYVVGAPVQLVSSTKYIFISVALQGPGV